MCAATYDQTDVTAAGAANTYAPRCLAPSSPRAATSPTVEIVVAELGATPALDQIYRLTYDGSVAGERTSPS